MAQHYLGSHGEHVGEGDILPEEAKEEKAEKIYQPKEEEPVKQAIAQSEGLKKVEEPEKKSKKK